MYVYIDTGKIRRYNCAIEKILFHSNSKLWVKRDFGTYRCWSPSVGGNIGGETAKNDAELKKAQEWKFTASYAFNIKYRWKRTVGTTRYSSYIWTEPSTCGEWRKCKVIVRVLLREHESSVIMNGDYSIAHKIEKKTEHHPWQKACHLQTIPQRSCLLYFFTACKERHPPFYGQCFPPLTRNKVFYGLRKLKKKFTDIIKRA